MVTVIVASPAVTPVTRPFLSTVAILLLLVLQLQAELLLQLHDSGRRYDAILTSEDAIAVGAVKYAIARGISIPDELAILGYNNSIQSVCCEPELSSVDTRVADLCDSTVHTIMDVLGGGELPPDTIIPASFVARSTTRSVS